ncbi:ATP-binding protein [Succinivibrio dextrinosolvens]|uniref:ATP-binding protein n=1 Tax=Succinivibrio dextrinosolvens TaxID=83771 RepID=UPI001922C53B|nr:ATP-binding protein [Succinivibrio dextrinosolvens]
MDDNVSIEKTDSPLTEFNQDSMLIGNKVSEFLETVYPSYLIEKGNIEKYLDKNSYLQLESITFFRIASYIIDNEEKSFENITKSFEKLASALYSIGIPFAYGIISNSKSTDLVLGIKGRKEVETVGTITQGILSGIQLEKYSPAFSQKNVYHGLMSGVPALFVNNEKHQFNLGPIMRGLNGQNYSLFFFANPVDPLIISKDISTLIAIKDSAFAVSKKNISNSLNFTKTVTKTESDTETENSIAPQVGGGAGLAIGAGIGAFGGPPGVIIGTAIGGGLGTLIGNIIGGGKSTSKSYSESISKSISNGKSISYDIQNGFALELMKYADIAIERLKKGQNNGFWQTAITYSAETEVSRNVIKACLNGELSRCDDEKLPMVSFELDSPNTGPISIPIFENNKKNPICSYLNSAELGILCTVPTDSVPNFELRIEKKLPLLTTSSEDSILNIGHLFDSKRILSNMPFRLSYKDLNKHTFICGITGSGKTTTVKKILSEAKKPFLIIESAKKEYRNFFIKPTVYTVGKPEINAPQINPFYILPGIPPQLHIDYLKDLFNASFSFYGPMSYILEKCLHNIYKNKGWDLDLGIHPLLSNSTNPANIYDIDNIKKQYDKQAHKFIFPTMNELKREINRYIEDELDYEGELAANIKTAIKVRLESLCVGAKGFTFNTYNHFNMKELLSDKVVFELEGLADDADKAFCVGLLIIYINEYRQIEKEVKGNQKIDLQHLLVIEEAHRLLKNIDTEKVTENFGNPKGKAVEHFTNMLAEMRAYGQGVIIAEQIPTKIAPDVIKNSSTKIVQRIVSLDDQVAIANTIGLSEKDAIQIGSLENGYSYCHKEGMALPCPVKISETYFEDNQEKELDLYVNDDYLVKDNRFTDISTYIISNLLNKEHFFGQKILGFINTLMLEDSNFSLCSLEKLKKELSYFMKKEEVVPIYSKYIENYSEILSNYIAENLEKGVYCVNTILSDEFIKELKSVISHPSVNGIDSLKKALRDYYDKDIDIFSKETIVALIKIQIKKKNLKLENKKVNFKPTIREYFIDVSEQTINEIENILMEI